MFTLLKRFYFQFRKLVSFSDQHREFWRKWVKFEESSWEFEESFLSIYRFSNDMERLWNAYAVKTLNILANALENVLANALGERSSRTLWRTFFANVLEKLFCERSIESFRDFANVKRTFRVQCSMNAT